MHASFRYGLGLAIAGLCALPLPAASWPAINPAELADTKPQVEPDAGIEILALETELDASDFNQTATDVYLRLKVYTNEGVDKVAKIQIPYNRQDDSVRNIEARTIKPNGTILELKRQDIFDREIVKAGNIRTRVKSFAPPGLEPGDIVEYRFRLSHEGRNVMFPFVFQSDKPARSVVFRLKPLALPIPGLSLQALYVNYPMKELKPNRQGYYEFAAQNLRSRKEEPFQPPATHILTSVVLYYAMDAAKSPEAFWGDASHRLSRETESTTKPTKTILAEVQRLVSPADMVDEKLRKLHDFCRSQIVNRNSDATGLTREERRKMKPNASAADTLKTRQGSATEINALFVALVRATGYDARLALGNDRTQFMFSPSVPVPFVFTRPVAAVNLGERWAFFDPGAAYLPAGMLDWRISDTAILIANDKQKLIQPLAGAPAERSRRHQTATLAIQEDGSLEGDVTLECTGYFEATEKNSLDAATPDEIEKRLKGDLEPHLKGVELSAIKVEHARQPLDPLKVSYHVKVPEFAERTGSRLFVQPGVFRRGGRALFEDATRATTIIFPHRYHELDEITLTVPEGLEIEAGSAPAGLDLGKVGAYAVDISWTAGKRTLHYKREFKLNAVAFPVDTYPAVKRIFEVIHERDNHTLTFRQTAAAEAKS
jgi:hypothetical protein